MRRVEFHWLNNKADKSAWEMDRQAIADSPWTIPAAYEMKLPVRDADRWV